MRNLKDIPIEKIENTERLSKEEITECAICQTALCLLEDAIMNADPQDEQLGKIINQTIETFHFDRSSTKDFLVERIKKRLSTLRQTNRNAPLQPREAREVVFKSIRKERAIYDKAYFKQLLNTNNTGDLTTAQRYMVYIRQYDTPYYNQALNKLLECFKELPEEIGLQKANERDNAYKVEDKTQLEKIENAQEIINQVFSSYDAYSEDESDHPFADFIDDAPSEYKLTKRVEKNLIPWSESLFSRILFDGKLSTITRTIHNDPRTAYLITEGEAAEIDATPASKCLENLKVKYSDPTMPGYNNAQNLLTIFTRVMDNDKTLARKPFPLLINAVCQKMRSSKEILIEIPFEVRTIEDQKYVYKTNPIWANYCRNNNLDYTPMEQSLKHLFLNNILNSNAADKDEEKKEKQTYRNAICDAIENCMIDFCKLNDLNSDIVQAAFGKYKYDENGKFSQKGYDALYKILFMSPNIVEDNNKKRDAGPLLHTSIHHDRERILFSSKPNTEDNFLVTINPNKELGYTAVYKKLLAIVSNMALVEGSYLPPQEIPATRGYFSFHNQILHGADISLRYKNGVSSQVLHYFITPVRPREEDVDSVDTRIVAMADANYRIMDKTKGNTPATSYKSFIAAKNKLLGRA